VGPLWGYRQEQLDPKFYSTYDVKFSLKVECRCSHYSLWIFALHSRMHGQKSFLIVCCVAALIWAMFICSSKCEFKSTTSSGVSHHRLKCSAYQKSAQDRQTLHHKISQAKKARTLQSRQRANAPQSVSAACYRIFVCFIHSNKC
jgi:hypothetical protein